MNMRIAGSIATLGILVAACSTEALDTEREAIGESEEALTKVVDIGTTAPVSTVIVNPTPTPPVVQRTAPKVMARSASGSTISLRLDRALAADEIPMSSVQVMVVRASGTGFVKQNIASSASLSSDGTTLNIALNQPVKGGEIYFPRSNWNPCSGSTSGTACKPRPARFGELIGRSGRTWPGDVLAPLDRNALEVSPVIAKTVTTTKVRGDLYDAVAVKATPAPPQTMITVAEAAPALQGAFHVASVTPGNGAENVARQTDRIVVDFAGGTIDCAATNHGKAGFRLHSVSPDVYDQQDMYEDPLAPFPNSTAAVWRGSVRCEQDTNRLVFTTPGLLLGDSWFQIDLNIHSLEGDVLENKVLEFKTARPGIQVLAQRVENWYGGDNTCDDDIFGTNYCDIYVTSAIATATVNQASRIPETGDFGGMQLFTQNQQSGSRYLYPERVLYATASPIDAIIDMQLYAHDADDDSTWKTVFNVASTIAASAGAALIPIQPQYGAIAEGVAAGFKGIADAIPSNEDDFLGSGRFVFTASDQRWGTQAVYPIELDLSKNAPNRGPVKVFLRTEELPRSWAPPAPIL